MTSITRTLSRRIQSLGRAILLLFIASLPDLNQAQEPLPAPLDLPFRNGDFEKATHLPEGWHPLREVVAGAKVTYGVSNLAHHGAKSATIEVAADSALSWYMLEQRVEPVRQGQTYRLSGWVKTDTLRDGYGAYIGICLVDRNNERVTFVESDRIQATQDWTLVNALAFIPEGVRAMKISLVSHGHGRAYYDDLQLELLHTAGPLPGHQVSVKLTEQVTADPFMGFGFQDDPFFFTACNLTRGVNEEDAKLRERRIRQLNPSHVRSFLFWDAFNPSHDLKTFVYDTELMKSLYRQFDLYQAMGTPITIADTFWEWKPEQFPYNEKNVERGVEIYLQILEYLIEKRGYSCIKRVSITNEPDIFFIPAGGTYASYLKANRLFREKLDQSPLKDKLTLVGCDMGLSKNWFRDTVRDADECFGLLAFHNYNKATQYPLIRETMKAILQTTREFSKPVKAPSGAKIHNPVLLAEYGFQLETDNPPNGCQAMKQYEYGLWNANACMDVLNAGLAGGSIWCVHAMYYSQDSFMEFGLWEFKDRAWAIRPIYYSCGLFTRLARPGMMPLKLKHDTESAEFNAGALKDAQGRVTLFMVNLAKVPIEVDLAGAPAGKYGRYEYSRERLAAIQSLPEDKREKVEESLAAGEVEIGKTIRLTLRPESLVALKAAQ